MADSVRLIAQTVIYALIVITIGYFASRPLYHQFPAGMAQIKLSFAHGAARKEACRKLTSQEIAKLPPNERRPNTCSRERVSVHVALWLDDKPIYEDVLPPTGIAKDGVSRVYKKFIVEPGRHVVAARLKDTRSDEGYNYEKTVQVDLKPLQNLAIDFKADQGGFIFR